MATVTLPKPTLADRRERSPVPSPSEEGYSIEPRSTGADASSLIRYAMLMMLSTCVLVFVLSVSLGQEPAWPLRNISQYGSPHVPAVYFFRGGGIASGALVIQAGLLLRHRVQWALLFIPIGVCSTGASAVMYTEDNVLHTAFALLTFFGLGTVEACAAHTAWTHRHHHPLFRSSGPPPWPRFWAAGAAYIYLGLAAVVGAYALGLDRQVTTAPGWPAPAPASEWPAPARAYTNQAPPPRRPHRSDSR